MRLTAISLAGFWAHTDTSRVANQYVFEHTLIAFALRSASRRGAANLGGSRPFRRPNYDMSPGSPMVMKTSLHWWRELQHAAPASAGVCRPDITGTVTMSLLKNAWLFSTARPRISMLAAV